MCVSTRLLKVANSRSLRPLSFCLDIAVGSTNLSRVCLFTFPNFSIRIPLVQPEYLSLVFGLWFPGVAVEAVDLTVIMTRPQGYKTFFMLTSVEHEILNGHKYKNIEKFSFY